MMSAEEGLLRRKMKFSFQQVPHVSLYISEGVGQEIINYAELSEPRAT